ncbi:MAG TPA: diguanylate cyclase [Trueperaceae bacterium]|nr:diguanylate cyclase [Trueperaceae bacterium]
MTASTALRSDDAAQRILLRNHRWVLGTCLSAYAVDLALCWTGVWGYGGDAPLRLIVVGLGALLLGRMGVRRRVARTWEVTGFSLLTLALVVHALAAVRAQGPSADTLMASGLWLYLIYVYAFYVLEAWRGALFAGGVWTAVTVGALALGYRQAPPAAGLAALAQFQGAGLVAILLAAMLAGWRTALEQAQLRVEEAERQSLTDALTGQPNRRALQLHVRREIARSRRTGAPFGLLLLDLDHFKLLNDVHGHAFGDAVLVEVADVVRATLRTGDELGRWGGEEFVVVAADAAADEAMDLAERLRACLEEHDWPVGALSVSIGVTCYHGGDGLEHLFKRADDALYRAKELGRNRCELELPAGTGPHPPG